MEPVSNLQGDQGFGENCWIQIISVLNKARPPPQFLGNDDLRGFEKGQILILDILPVFLENIKIMGGGSFGMVPEHTCFICQGDAQALFPPHIGYRGQ